MHHLLAPGYAELCGALANQIREINSKGLENVILLCRLISRRGALPHIPVLEAQDVERVLEHSAHVALRRI